MKFEHDIQHKNLNAMLLIISTFNSMSKKVFAWGGGVVVVLKKAGECSKFSPELEKMFPFVASMRASSSKSFQQAIR